jgi:predicted phosphodiesterase
MAKIAIINDSHAGARNDSLAFNDFFFDFWDNVFFPYLEKHKIKKVYHLGDFVDRRKFISFTILNHWRKHFVGRMEKMGIEMVCLVGNHDVPYKASNEINAIEELFGEYKNIKVIKSPQDWDIDGLKVAMVPWIQAGNYQETLDYIAKTDATVMFGHLELSGFEMDRGNFCETGLSRTLFNKFDIVLSGHFHHKSTDGTVTYLGNQYEMTWADYNDPRGFHIFDTKKLDLKFVENPHKMFHKIVYDDKADFTFDYLKSLNLEQYKNRYVKIVVLNKSNVYLFDTFLEWLYKVGPIDVSIVDDTFGAAFDEASENLDLAEDTITTLYRYVDELPTELDRNSIKNEIRELYLESVNSEQI